MLEPEYHQVFIDYQRKPGPASNTAMLTALKPVIDSALKTYVGSPVSPTMQARAQLAVLASLPRYEPTRAKLRTYLMTQLQSLRRSGIRENQLIRLPERVALDLSRLRGVENELSDELGRSPSSSELARKAGFSLAQLAKLRQVRPGLLEGQLLGSMGEAGEGVELPAAQGAHNYHPAWLDFVYHDLQPTDQLLLEHTYGLHGQPVLSKSELARKLGVTPGAISQRSARIQDRLDAREHFGGLF